MITVREAPPVAKEDGETLMLFTLMSLSLSEGQLVSYNDAPPPPPFECTRSLPIWTTMKYDDWYTTAQSVPVAEISIFSSYAILHPNIYCRMLLYIIRMQYHIRMRYSNI